MNPTDQSKRNMMDHIPAAPETKSADIASAFDEFMRSFESFKETNDERIGRIEKRADPLTDEKVARIGLALDANKRVLDEMVLKSRRPALARDRILSGAEQEYAKAFHSYMRHGEATGLKSLEGKALAVSTNAGADGGFLVPEETEREIGRRLAVVSPLRAIAGHREVSGNVYRKPFLVTGAASGWVAETAERAETTSPTLAELAFPTMELYAMPAATQTLLDDSAVNIDEWIAGEIDTVFAEQEGTAFVGGNGTTEPKGFLSYTPVEESAWEWGKLGFVLSGADGGFAAEDPSDALVDLVYSLKAGYRQNGTFVMNRRTQAEVRKLKDDSGNYLWAPPATAGGQATLMGFPVAEAEDMPDIDDETFSIAFGDFRRGYLVVDRLGVRVLRDPYSAKPYVLFYVTKRVGGGVADFDAIKLLKFAAPEA
jgi:HK97 family phage major capsid protein